MYLYEPATDYSNEIWGKIVWHKLCILLNQISIAQNIIYQITIFLLQAKCM